jgi:hypothetical protein
VGDVEPREDLPSVAAAVEPFSDADAGKRIYDAAKPVHIELRTKASTSVRRAIKQQAERLAAYRHVPLAGIDLDS